jgi:integrase
MTDRPTPPQATEAEAHIVGALLENAGLVGEGVTSGLNMHRARHSLARAMRRTSGVDGASQALGHSDLSTTLGIYGHQDESDLERAFEEFARWRREQEAEDE